MSMSMMRDAAKTLKKYEKGDDVETAEVRNAVKVLNDLREFAILMDMRLLREWVSSRQMHMQDVLDSRRKKR